MEQLLKPFPQVAELLVGAVLAEQHDEWAEARPKGESGGTKFAQPLLRELIIARRTDVRKRVVRPSFACPRRAGFSTPAAVLPRIHRRKGLILPTTSPPAAATPSAINQWVSIAMVSIPINWNRRERDGTRWIGLVSNALECVA